MSRIPTTAEINAWVSAGTAESDVLEFKRTTWPSGEPGTRECLKDITAFANTRGGLIVLGIIDKDNAAKGIAPLSSEIAEAERSRIDNLIHDGVQPRLYGVKIEPVAVEGGVVLAIAIPRSPSRPHRVSSHRVNRYYLRKSTGVYEADVADLRALFLQGAEVGERALRWHEDRRAALHTGDVVANIASGANGVVLHVIPADAFSGANVVDLKAAKGMLGSWWPLAPVGFNHRYVFDGFLAYGTGDPCHGYTLVQRNGIVEAVKVGLFDPENGLLYAKQVEGMIVGYARRYVSALYSLGVVPPVFVLVTLEGVRDAAISTGGMWSDSAAITRDNLTLPVAVIEEADSDAVVGAAFRATFDALWNAGGKEASPQFDDAGLWTGVVPD